MPTIQRRDVSISDVGSRISACSTPVHAGVDGEDGLIGSLPPIAGGTGIPISGQLRIGRKWTFKGKVHSYLNARCEVGHFDAKGSFKFKDGTFLSAAFLRPCQVRG